ncbi:carbonic anhydrase [Paucidesulfovibrio gracilis DSM 16080]|uniref:Carbonic anhydrase n=1 Tax=Paucidesulfovibrio gracilis DSM 16080 TaxID=1121449 RepID=A0A1T4X6G8_9BACT|nr:carbonic anhydrase [Paucidesulfovibrio gracilis]SKA84645.1 carbonic anhydrase [Paucidesulfovibrio gracilis DSM 16080]
MQDITKFLTGFRKFQQHCLTNEGELLEQLRQGQAPKVLMIACCDSRVDPAVLMDSDLGELFTLRNIASIVPPYERGGGFHGVSSAIEYAVRHLQVEHIVVLGHRQCGGVHALLNGCGPDDDFIDEWVNILEPARQLAMEKYADANPAERERACEQASVLVSLRNLLTFPWIKERFENETLILHGWYFDLETGELLSYHPDTKQFETLVAIDHD